MLRLIYRINYFICANFGRPAVAVAHLPDSNCTLIFAHQALAGLRILISACDNLWSVCVRFDQLHCERMVLMTFQLSRSALWPLMVEIRVLFGNFLCSS